MDSGAEQQPERKPPSSDAAGDSGVTTPQRPAQQRIRAFCRFVYRYGTQLGTLSLAVITAILVVVAWRQLGTLESHNRRSARAYVFFDSGLIEKHGDQYLVILRVKNSSQTPALQVTHSWSAAIYDYPLPGRPPWGIVAFETVDDRLSLDIGANTSVTLGDPKILTITQADKDGIVARTRAIYVWAKLDFLDTFQNWQCTYLLAVNLPGDGAERWELRNYNHSVSDYPGDCSNLHGRATAP
jgi:hypothetical protein